MHQNLVVATVFTSDGPFTRENVRTTRAMCGRVIREMDRFVLLADQPIHVDGVDFIKSAHGWSREHAPLELFRTIFKEAERVLFLDLGCVILDEIDEVVNRPERFVRTPDCRVMLWTANDMYDVYRSFARRPRLELTLAHLLKIHYPHSAIFEEHQVSSQCGAMAPSTMIATFDGVPGVEHEWVSEVYRAEEEYVPLKLNRK